MSPPKRKRRFLIPVAVNSPTIGAAAGLAIAMYPMHQIAPRDRGNSPVVIDLDHVDQEIAQIVAIAKCHCRACLTKANVGDVDYDSRDTPIRCINERVDKACLPVCRDKSFRSAIIRWANAGAK